MTTNDVFCIVLVRIDLFQWATLLFQPFWPDIWPNRVQKGQKRPFWAISEAGGSKLVEQCGTRVEQVRAHPQVREGHLGAPEGPRKGPKRPKTALFGHKRIWWPPKGPPDHRNGSIASPWMCPDLFHLYSTLFRQCGATTLPYGTKIIILGHLGPFWGSIGASHRPP